MIGDAFWRGVVSALARVLPVAVLPVALAACGSPTGASDFSLVREQPVAATYAELGTAMLGPEISALFPGLKVIRSRPDDQSVLYRVPGSGPTDSTILLRLETGPDGRSTVISASVSVPPVRAMIGGQQKVISEARVERELRGLIADKSGEAARKALSGLLAAIAIATDSKAMADVQQMMKDPARASAALAALDSGLFDRYDPEADADSADRAEGSQALPADEPDAAQARAEDAQREAEWREERRLNQAAAAEDAANGEAPEPELPNSE